MRTISRTTIKTWFYSSLATTTIAALTIPVRVAAVDPLGNLEKAGKSAGYASYQQSPVYLAGRIIGYFTGLLGTIFVILVIYAGFLWMTAQGNEEQITKAKKMLTNAIIGMILVFMAYAISSFVITALVASTDTSTDPG